MYARNDELPTEATLQSAGTQGASSGPLSPFCILCAPLLKRVCCLTGDHVQLQTSLVHTGA
jgi:hypothetical protein